MLGGVDCLVEKDKWPVTQACKVELRGTRKKGESNKCGRSAHSEAVWLGLGKCLEAYPGAQAGDKMSDRRGL